jgi:hypothetical protein
MQVMGILGKRAHGLLEDHGLRALRRAAAPMVKLLMSVQYGGGTREGHRERVRLRRQAQGEKVSWVALAL